MKTKGVPFFMLSVPGQQSGKFIFSVRFPSQGNWVIVCIEILIIAAGTL
jgi:hypothetical protein